MLNTTYELAQGVQVRREKFGLLFYNYRGPRLYFVPSQDLIGADFFQGEQSVTTLIEDIRSKKKWPAKWIRTRVRQVIGSLESKGLIHGK